MKNFEMPKKLVLDESTYTPTYGRFIAEPFERGYGVTIGNSLRRVLISSIEGTAVTGIRMYIKALRLHIFPDKLIRLYVKEYASCRAYIL